MADRETLWLSKIFNKNYKSLNKVKIERKSNEKGDALSTTRDITNQFI